MISYLIFVYLFAFASCEAFHANQHLPVQKYQPPAQYQAAAYPQYIPIYTQPLKSNYNPQLSASQIEDLQRQYQQWQIGYPPASQSGQAPPQPGQPAGQPGVVWISAPQYSYYPPPPNSNYPPPQQYPPPPPYPPQSPGQSQYPPPSPGSGGADPSATRQTGSTSAVSQPGYETSSEYPTSSQPSSSYPPDSYPSSSSEYPPSSETPSTSYAPSTESSSYSTPETEKPSTEEPYPSLSTDGGSNYPSTSTEYGSSYPSSSTEYPPGSSYPPSSTGYPSQNETTSTTYKPENGTGNSTNKNPLLKYCKEPRGQFASDDCRKFVNCWDEVAVEQACPNGLVFNEEKHYCDYPSNVDCGNRTSGSNSSTPGNGTDGFPPKNPACPDTYGTYRNKSNCAAFYVCVSGEPIDFNCPPGTVYSDDLKVCDYPYRTDCKGAPTIPTVEQNATEPSPYDNSTSSSPSSSSEPSYTSSSPYPSYPSTSTNYPPPSSSESNSSPYYPPSSTTTDYPASSTVTVPPAPVSEYPAPPPPGVDPIGSYNYNLKKLPESIVNTGVRCYHSNVFRLTPDCSSVTVCQDGLTYIVNCGSVTSFDAYEQRCVPSFRARC